MPAFLSCRLNGATTDPSRSTARELGHIDRLTRPRIYQYGFTQAQNGAGILVLDPIVAG